MALSACGNDFESVRLVMASGNSGGVYNKLSEALADAWSGQLGIERPQVVPTKGSVDNLERLRTGTAQVGFSQADAAEDANARNEGPHKLRALARMHDDYLQLVVRDDLPVTTLSELKGRRVSLGPATSGVKLIADRLLKSAQISPETDLQVRYLDLNDATQAMLDGAIDAFFWVGGVPTGQVTALAKTMKLRMLDLKDVLVKLREQYPVYGSATLPRSAYQLSGGPIVTLVVRNFLLVSDTMSDDVAEALVRGLFEAQPQLESASPVARSIEMRSAIETSPIELHPGAMRYYRAAKV
jgi:TRAP transporter TAXI family solute receptor